MPVDREPYDLGVAPGAIEGPRLAPLWSLLADPGFRASVEALGGYSAKEMGRRLRCSPGPFGLMAVVFNRGVVARDKVLPAGRGPAPMDPPLAGR